MAALNKDCSTNSQSQDPSVANEDLGDSTTSETLKTLDSLATFLAISKPVPKETTPSRWLSKYQWLQILFLCTGSTISALYLASLVADLSHLAGKPLPLVDLFHILSNIIEPLRGPVVIVAFFSGKKDMCNLVANVHNVLSFRISQHQRPTKPVITRWIICSAVTTVTIIFISWDFLAWSSLGGASFNITALTRSSQTFEKFGIRFSRWQIYTIWITLGLPPLLYTLVIQTLVAFLCWVFYKSQLKYKQRLGSLDVSLGAAVIKHRILELLEFRDRLVVLHESIDGSFQCVTFVAYCVDVISMLIYTAISALLSGKPLFVYLSGTFMYGFLITVFNYQAIRIDHMESEIQVVSLKLIQNLRHLTVKKEGNEIMKLLQIMQDHHKLRFGMNIVPGHTVNGALLLKTVALIASISLVATELLR